MKLNGKRITGANETIIVIPRSNSDSIVFKARAILDMAEFEEMCPAPEPPIRKYAGGREHKNTKDPGYIQQIENHSALRLSWIVLMSLSANENLEWENLDISDPTTWNNFRKELTEAGFSTIEINRIVAECLEVNALNEEKIEEARALFLLQAQDQADE